jgi:predicted TIM-barrel fold metal-dependent hydrolase
MLSRRDAVKAALGAGSAIAVEGAQPTVAQTGSGRRRRLVDAQVHMWTAERVDWKWIPGIPPHLPEPFTAERLLPMMDEAGVERVIIVPPMWPGDRNDYAIEVAQRYPGRFGITGRISLDDPASPARLQTWKQQPGMLGVRMTFIGKGAAPLSDGSADWFWLAAEKAGVPVTFLAPADMPKFATIAERHPELTLIIDHISMAAGASNDDAVAQSIALAKYPNVSVKMKSGPQYSKEAYPYRDLLPLFKRTFDAFGPQRCYWETDMTQTFDKVSYKQRITHFTEELNFLSEEDKDWLMGRAILARLNWA